MCSNPIPHLSVICIGAEKETDWLLLPLLVTRSTQWLDAVEAQEEAAEAAEREAEAEAR